MIGRAPDAGEEIRFEAQERAFRRNLFVVAGVHLAVLGVLFALGKLQPRHARTELMWLDGGALGGGEQSDAGDSPSEAVSAPEPDPPEQLAKIDPAPPPPPSVPRPTSEIVLPRSTPETTPALKPATPRPATPKPQTPKPETPKPKSTPKSTPKVTPKSTPKPTTAHKAASPKPESSPAAVAKGSATQNKNASASGDGTPAMAKSGTGSNAGSGKGSGKAGGGTGTGTNEFAWYYQMLDERFTSRWEQPLSIVRSTQQFVTTLKIRINKDGTIVSREIANSSGNPVMDESVLAAARKVSAVDPLPAGLGGESFDVNINFALDQGP